MVNEAGAFRKNRQKPACAGKMEDEGRAFLHTWHMGKQGLIERGSKMIRKRKQFRTRLCGALAAGAAVCLSLFAGPAIRGYAADADKVYEVRVVATNDMHARAESSKSSYGFGRIKTIADEARDAADLALLLDAGDFYHGQAFATLTEGENIAKLAAAAGYDAVCVGNHDWSYGKERLRTLAELTAKENQSGGFALLGGNVKKSDGQPFFAQQYLVKEMPAEGETVKVGVFGVIDPQLYTKTTPSNVEGLVFEDMAGYVKQAVADLQAQGCGLIIGMAHCNAPAQLAQSMSGVDLWIAGHEHVSLEEQVADQAGKRVYVLEAGYYGAQVNVAQMRFTYEKGESGKYEVQGLTITPSARKEDRIAQTASDSAVDALYQSLADAQEGILSETVGQTPVKLEATWEAVRIGETTMGRLVTEAYLKESGADVALENAGGIRTGRDIEAGEVTKRDAVDTFPYGNYLVTKELTGAQLKELLEICIEIGKKNQAANAAGDYDGWPQESGSYLQVGGVQVSFDPDKDAGDRITRLEIGGQPVDGAKKYTVATNNYAAESGDYPMLAEAEEKNQYTACDEIFIRYLQQTEPEVLKKALQAARMVEQKAGGDTPVEPSAPKRTTLKKLTAKKNGFQAVWKKVSSATGYELQYATDKNFSKGSTKILRISKKTTVKKTVKGLKGNKKYYVRVRICQDVSGVHSHSKWSAAKTVKTLKG